MRIIATGCNIHYDEIVSALDKDAAQRNGVLGVFYGYDDRFPSANSMEQFLKHIGIGKMN